MKLLLLFSLLLTSAVWAQSSAASGTSSMTFEELRAAYATALKKEHTPVLQEYLAELQRSLSSTTTSGRPAVEAEIARVQALIASTGIFEPYTKPATSQRVSGQGRQGSGVVLTLDPKNVQPGPVVTEEPDAKVMLGKGVWPCPLIPAGTYDLVARYETHSVPPDALLRITIGKQSFEKKVSQANITGVGKARVLRLVQFTLEQDLVDSEISIISQPGPPWFGLRTAFVAHPLPPKNKPPAIK